MFSDSAMYDCSKLLYDDFALEAICPFQTSFLPWPGGSRISLSLPEEKSILAITGIHLFDPLACAKRQIEG